MDYILTYSKKKIEMSVTKENVFGFAIGRAKDNSRNWCIIMPFLVIDITYTAPKKGDI